MEILVDADHTNGRIQDPVFYHPELNEIKVWSQFNVLFPEKYGWIVIGYL